MSRQTTDAAPDGDGGAADAGALKPGRIHRTRVVLWVASECGVDAADLARYLEAAHGGAASVTLVSVEEIPANDLRDGSPIDDPSACALAFQHWRHRDAQSDACVARVDGGACTVDPTQCALAGAGDFPAESLLSKEPAMPPRRPREERQVAYSSHREFHFRHRREHEHRKAEPPAQPLHQGLLRRISDAIGGGSGHPLALSAAAAKVPGRDMALPRRDASANGAAHIDGDAPSPACEIAGPLTVIIASGRKRLLDALMPRLASEPDIKVLGDPITDQAHLLMCLEQRLPGLLLLDKPVFDQIGPRSIRMIHAKAPGLRVLLLCDEVDAGLVEAVLHHRFHGVLLTSCSPDASVKAIRAVSRGEFWLPRNLLAHAVFDPLQAPALADGAAQADRSLDDVEDALTPREAQVVEHLRQGYTNKEIARRLGIMEDTVKKHLQSVFAKLGVHRRALVVLRPIVGPLAVA